MSVKANASQAAEAWKAGFTGASAKYTAGINAVTTAPGQLAAQQQNLYAQRVQERKAYWAAKVAGVSLQDWKNQATTIGVSRLGSGAEKGAPKMAAFMTKFLPVLSNIVDGLGPRGTFDQNLSRLTKYLTELHGQQGNF